MEKQYVNTERAHFMCPNMHFGIILTLDAEYSFEKVNAVLMDLANAHPFLRSRIQKDTDSIELFYSIYDTSQIYIQEKKDQKAFLNDYSKISNEEWNVFEHGLLKVYLYPMKDEFKALFISHHLLGDGCCLLELVCEFVNTYVQGRKPNYVEESLIKDISDLPPKSKLSGLSKLLVLRLNKQWRKEDNIVSYEEYLRFAQKFAKENPVTYEITTFEREKVDTIRRQCKEHDVSVNDYLMADLYLESGTQKIIIAANIRDKLKNYRQGAMGNYATAMGIVCKDNSKDIIQKAKKVHQQVKKHRNSNRKLMLILSCYLTMDKSLIDAAAIATLGEFESKAAKFVGGNMFGFSKREGYSITNLGAIDNPYIKEAVFLPPASPATRKTIGVLTVNGRMQLCSSNYTSRER